MPKFDDFALLHKSARLRRGFRFGQAVHAAHLRHGVEDGQVVAVNFERQAVSVGYKSIAENVIEVAMGIKQPYGAQLTAGNFAGQFVAFAGVVAAGVNDDALAGVVEDQISVFREVVENQLNNLRHNFFFLKTVEPAQRYYLRAGKGR